MMLFVEGLRRKYCDCQIWMVLGCGQEKNFRDMIEEALGCDKIMLVQSSHFKSITVDDLFSEIPETMRSKIINQTMGGLKESRKGGNVADGLLKTLNHAR